MTESTLLRAMHKELEQRLDAGWNTVIGINGKMMVCEDGAVIELHQPLHTVHEPEGETARVILKHDKYTMHTIYHNRKLFYHLEIGEPQSFFVFTKGTDAKHVVDLFVTAIPRKRKTAPE